MPSTATTQTASVFMLCYLPKRMEEEDSLLGKEKDSSTHQSCFSLRVIWSQVEFISGLVSGQEVQAASRQGDFGLAGLVALRSAYFRSKCQGGLRSM